MSKTLTFKVLDTGKLPEGIKHTLSVLFPAYAGKTLRLSISEAKEKRSLEANAYYWVAIVPHMRKFRFECGDALSIEQVHEDMLAQFAPTVTGKRPDGTLYTRPMRSKEMSVSEMAQYINCITAWLATEGWPVPMEGL